MGIKNLKKVLKDACPEAFGKKDEVLPDVMLFEGAGMFRRALCADIGTRDDYCAAFLRDLRFFFSKTKKEPQREFVAVVVMDKWHHTPPQKAREQAARRAGEATRIATERAAGNYTDFPKEAPLGPLEAKDDAVAYRSFDILTQPHARHALLQYFETRMKAMLVPPNTRLIVDLTESHSQEFPDLCKSNAFEVRCEYQNHQTGSGACIGHIRPLPKIKVFGEAEVALAYYLTAFAYEKPALVGVRVDDTDVVPLLYAVRPLHPQTRLHWYDGHSDGYIDLSVLYTALMRKYLLSPQLLIYFCAAMGCDYAKKNTITHNVGPGKLWDRTVAYAAAVRKHEAPRLYTFGDYLKFVHPAGVPADETKGATPDGNEKKKRKVAPTGATRTALITIKRSGSEPPRAAEELRPVVTAASRESDKSSAWHNTVHEVDTFLFRYWTQKHEPIDLF